MTNLHKSQAPRGFTLVELLVVIAIIGILVGLTLPAVQMARETARRTSCNNNLRNLGLAAQQFHDVRKHFPPARVLGPFPKLKIFNQVEHGWTVFLLPYLEQRPLYERYSFEVDFRHPDNAAVIETRLPVMICASAPGRATDSFTSAGFDWRTEPADYTPIMRVHPIVVAAGFADDVVKLHGAMGSNKFYRYRDMRDGASNTILLSEAAGRPQHWTAGQFQPENRIRGSGWANSRNAFSLHGATDDGLFFPGPCAVNCTNDREIYAFHPGGANAVFADGSVRFLPKTAGIRETARLITIDGREVNQP